MCTSMPLLIFMLFELVIPQKYYWVSFLLAFIYGFCPLGYLNSITTLNIWVGLFKHYGITNLDVINKIRFCKKWDRPWSRGFGGGCDTLSFQGQYHGGWREGLGHLGEGASVFRFWSHPFISECLCELRTQPCVSLTSLLWTEGSDRLTRQEDWTKDCLSDDEHNACCLKTFVFYNLLYYCYFCVLEIWRDRFHRMFLIFTPFLTF